MKALVDIQKELRAMLTKSISDVLKALQEYLPEGAEKYREVLILEGQLHDAEKQLLYGTISNEQLQITYNRLRKALLEFIQSLEQTDFDPQNPDQPANAGKKIRQGHVLYRIPNAMAQWRDTKCLVRIALDQEMLKRNLKVDEQVQFKGIRISELMHVALLDPSIDPPFHIRAINSPEQFIEADDYTEWVFYVMPVRVGRFPLILKVSVIELVHGKERKREIILEEEVQIVSSGEKEGAAMTEQAPALRETFKSANESLMFSSPQPEEKQALPKTQKWRRTGLIAGVLLVLFFCSTYLFRQPATNTMVQVTTGDEAARELVLPDSSLIVLNRNSVITYPENFLAEAARPVSLSGEAYFEVTRMADIPFIVTTAHARVKVLGTVFNLRAYAEETQTEVSLEEGLLSFDSKNQPQSVLLQPGKTARLDHATGIISMMASAGANTMAWKTKELVFEDTPVREVFPLLEHLYDVRIEVENEAILDCLITGHYVDMPFEQVLDIIATVLIVDPQIVSEGVIRMKGEGCE